MRADFEGHEPVPAASRNFFAVPGHVGAGVAVLWPRGRDHLRVSGRDERACGGEQGTQKPVALHVSQSMHYK